MPGFTLGFPGDTNAQNVAANVKPITTFAWYVSSLFDGMKSRNSGDPMVYLKDCTPPEFAFNTEEYESASIKLKYASKITWNDVKLSFYDTVGLLPIIQEWRSSVWTREEGIKTAKEYKKSTKIVTLNAAGGYEDGWWLIGSWPKQVSYAALTYTSSDMHSVDVTIAYDWAEIRPGTFF